MLRLIGRNFVAISLVYLFTASICYATETSIGKLPGAKILQASCDPTADSSSSTSCASQNITRDNFSIKISFDASQPDRDANGNPWAQVPVTVPGNPMLPLSYVTTNGYSAIFNSTACGATPNCYPISSVYDENGNQISSPTLSYTIVGAPILNGANAVYTAPTQAKVPTSNIVVTNVTALRVDGSGNPVLDANNNFVFDNVVYTRTGANTVAVDTFGVGYQSCTAGLQETYVSGKPVMDKNCEIVKDYNRCAGNSSCNYALVSGGDMYEPPVLSGSSLVYSGNKQVYPGIQIKAVAGAPTTSNVSGSLFRIVFPAVPQAEVSGFSRQIDVAPNAPSGTYLQTHFEVEYISNKACVYAYGADASKRWRVSNDYPTSLNDVYDMSDSATPIDPLRQPTDRLSNAMDPSGDNCVPAPPPAVVMQPLVWNAMVSPVCINFDTSSSQFKWPADAGFNGRRSRSLLGVIVECVEDTMLKMFYPAVIANANNAAPQVTFFSSMQSKVQGAIRGLMAMYIIFFGYKLMIGKEVPKKDQWMWLAIKLSLVTYFALGSGMTIWLPDMINISKRLSVIVMEAGLGTPGSTEFYPYCDFRDHSKFKYPAGKEYMELWDMIDCRISKYLGVGDNEEDLQAPQILFVAALAPISSGLGLPICLLSMMFLIITIMVVVRIAHIYIASFVGLMMLIFISPLAIPTVLFEHVKGVFTAWSTQVIGFLLQPVILFCFLSFMFVVIDGQMFGGNHAFTPAGVDVPSMKIVNNSGVVTVSNQACGDTGNVCKDKAAPAYQYQTVIVHKNKWPSDKIWGLEVQSLDYVGHDDGLALLIGLGKLSLIMFIVYAVIDSLESVSARLASVMSANAGKGAADLSPIQVASPAQIFKGGMKGIEGAKNAGAYVGKGVARGGAAVGKGLWAGANAAPGALKALPGAIASAPGNLKQKANSVANTVSNRMHGISAKDERKMAADKAEAKRTGVAASNAQRMMANLANDGKSIVPHAPEGEHASSKNPFTLAPPVLGPLAPNSPEMIAKRSAVLTPPPMLTQPTTGSSGTLGKRSTVGSPPDAAEKTVSLVQPSAPPADDA